MDKLWTKSPKELMNDLHTTTKGLTPQEAAARIEKFGKNVLAEEKKKSMFLVFLSQFQDLLVLILIAAAIISMLSGNSESTIVIVAVITLNAILGTVQHAKAEKSLDSLKSLSSPNAKVLRDGTKLQLPSSMVVPGDILLLEAGDLVCADGRILENYSLQVNESSLTGESENVNKISESIAKEELPLGDRKNLVYSGSLVAYGRANVLVTHTGMGTELGKIATLMNETKQNKTPLQVSLDAFSKKLAIVVLIICGVVFALSLYRSMPILDSLMFAVALAVAAIPEALSSIVTIVLAIGTEKMVKENAIIKELKAVESLGSVSVICSDKTGTLTQNKMTVQNIYAGDTICEPKQLDFENNKIHNLLMSTAILTNNSSYDGETPIGDPTETALIDLARNLGINENYFRDQHPRLSELPFDSQRKLMSTCHELNGQQLLLTKGAVDVLLPRLNNILTKDGVQTITDEDRINIENANNHFSQNGLRVLAFALKEWKQGTNISVEDEYDYTFVGLISMIDPPREESKKAVQDAIKAGIRPVMITGDHKVTATAIAKQIGIFNDGDLAITGTELEKMSDEQLCTDVDKISVYARVSPEHKIKIVNAWQNRGCIVSMTGDGVNDAPALKKANIGIAMGITGTDVSKDAASMILTDDNFATIVKAIANGRSVYANIKNSIQFLLSGNMAGIFSVLYTSIFALPIPFLPVHLLFINLLTDSLPAIAIGMEPSANDVLTKKPRDPKEPILTKHLLQRIGLEGLLIAIFTMIAYHMGLSAGGASLASTMAFSTLTLARLFHGFNCRNEKSIFKIGLFSNKYSIFAFVLGTLFLTTVLVVPFASKLFAVAPLTLQNIGGIVALAVAPTILIQLFKMLRHR